MTKLLAIFLLLIAVLVRADDDIVSVDTKAGLITIEQKGMLKSYRLKPLTEVTINGSKASVDALRSGMQVDVSLSDAQTVSKIAVRGNVGVPSSAPQATATPSTFANSLLTGQFTRRILLKAAVDAGDNVIIADGKLHIQHIDWSKPKDFSINGVKWSPQWNNNTSDDFIKFNPPLAPFVGGNLVVKKVKGRGDVNVVESPSEANGQKLVVHLQDNGPGASEFEVRITW